MEQEIKKETSRLNSQKYKPVSKEKNIKRTVITFLIIQALAFADAWFVLWIIAKLTR